jgi:hypothetical protein
MTQASKFYEELQNIFFVFFMEPCYINDSKIWKPFPFINILTMNNTMKPK